MVNYMSEMLLCMPPEELAEEGGPSAEEILESMEMMCTKNMKGEYCAVGFQAFEDADLDGDDMECETIIDLGCCMGTALELMETFGETTELADAQAGLEDCQITTTPMACPRPGETVETVKVLINIAGVDAASVIALDDDEKAALIDAIATSVATDADVGRADIEVVLSANADDGSLDATVFIIPSGDSTASEIAEGDDLGDSLTADAIATSLEGTEAEVSAEDLTIGEATAKLVEQAGEGEPLDIFSPSDFAAAPAALPTLLGGVVSVTLAAF
jgi:hypothetical protein